MFKQLINALICLSLLFTIPAFSLTHSQPRTYTGYECGTDFELKTCGVTKYDSCPSKSCAGSYDAETWTLSGEWQCPLPWPQCDAERKKVLNELCARKQGGAMAPGSTYQSWGNGLFHYDSICKRQEFVASCENSTCKPLEYAYCPDETRPKPKTCELRKTQAELDAYIAQVSADIDYNAEQYAANLGNFLAKVQEKVQMACLIDTYYGKKQFEAIVDDLVTKWESNFGEIYEQGTYKDECASSENVAPKDLSFRDLTCSVLTIQQVRDGSKNSESDPALKRFYNNCFAQKAYETPKKWFEFHLEEINLLLSDVVSSKSAAYKKSLEDLQTSLLNEEIVTPGQ